MPKDVRYRCDGPGGEVVFREPAAGLPPGWRRGHIVVWDERDRRTHDERKQGQVRKTVYLCQECDEPVCGGEILRDALRHQNEASPGRR